MSRLRTALLFAALALPAMAHAKDLTVGFTLDAVNLDPANHRVRETETIMRNIYDGAVTRDPQMKVVPELAEFLEADRPDDLRVQDPPGRACSTTARR